MLNVFISTWRRAGRFKWIVEIHPKVVVKGCPERASVVASLSASEVLSRAYYY